MAACFLLTMRSIVSVRVRVLGGGLFQAISKIFLRSGFKYDRKQTLYAVQAQPSPSLCPAKTAYVS